MRKQTKWTLAVTGAELVLLESILWATVNHWHINEFIRANVTIAAYLGLVLTIVMAIAWLAENFDE